MQKLEFPRAIRPRRKRTRSSECYATVIASVYIACLASADSYGICLRSPSTGRNQSSLDPPENPFDPRPRSSATSLSLLFLVALTLETREMNFWLSAFELFSEIFLLHRCWRHFIQLARVINNFFQNYECTLFTCNKKKKNICNGCNSIVFCVVRPRLFCRYCRWNIYRVNPVPNIPLEIMSIVIMDISHFYWQKYKFARSSATQLLNWKPAA